MISKLFVYLFTFFSLVSVLNAADSETSCSAGNKISVDLNRDLLRSIGFQPKGLVFDYIKFGQLEYRFSQPFFTEIPINEAGDTTQVEVVSASMEMDAEVVSPRSEFLRRVTVNLPKPGKNDSISVSGGFLQLINQQNLRLSGNIRYVDNSSKVKWWRQGKSNTPIWLDLKLSITEDRTDLSISPDFRKGPTNVSGPLTKILDGILLPISLTLKIFDQPTIGEAVDKDIADSIDAEFSKQSEWISEYVKSIFLVESMNNLVSDKALLFSEVFKRRLRYTSQVGFSGQNPNALFMKIFNSKIPLPQTSNAKVFLNIVKESDKSDYKTLMSPKSACQLLKDLFLLSNINLEKASGQKVVTIEKGQNLDELAKKYFLDNNFAMTIAQENGMYKYESLKEGDTLKIPTMNSILKKDIHYVTKGDNLWNIASEYKIPFHDLINSNPSLEESGNLIFPGMLIQLPVS